MESFKLMIKTIIAGIIAQGDARAAADKATIVKLSADAQTLTEKLAAVESELGASKATIIEVSAKAQTLADKVAELQQALDSVPDAISSSLMAQAAEQAIALNELTSELESEFGTPKALEAAVELAAAINSDSSAMEVEANPTPFADAVAVAVIDSPIIETPSIVAEDQSIGTSTETPAEVTEAAVEAVVEAAAVATEAIEIAEEIAAE
jgi:uncharacterized phage infection (PIP) family protein YhgE